MATKKLRPFQSKAVAKTIAELTKRDRAKVIMPCGTGKTLVGLHVAKRKSPTRTLVVAPSLALVKQLLDEYAEGAELPRVLVVCSDDSTAKEAREKYDIPGVTTDAKVIAKELRRKSRLIVFSTYQSTPKIAEAFKSKVPAFDLAVFDEAHHMAGASKIFTTALDDGLIKIRKRVFMTATPRVATKSAKSQADDEGYTLACMDDESQFGREAFYMSFNDAIEGGHLTDYRVAIFVVKESEIQSLVENNEDAKEVAKRVALIRAMQQHDIRKVLTYHRTVKKMNWFAEIGIRKTFDDFKESGQVTGTLWSGALEGSDGAGTRRETLNHFASLNGDSRAVLNNCKVLQEGVDCPSVDAVCLMEPRTQPVDIVQIVGRAIRNSPDKKIATIILPVFMPKGVEDDVEAFVASSDFAPVWDVISAIKSHDSRVQGWVSSAGSFGSGEAKSHIDFNINTPAGIQGKFFEAIESRIVSRFHEPMKLTEDLIWGWMQEYREKHGRWPSCASKEKCPDGSTWGTVNTALVKKLRGLHRVSSLSILRCSKSGDTLSIYTNIHVDDVIIWMKQYRNEHGKWPCVSTPAKTTSGLTWRQVDHKLRQKGTSLFLLLLRVSGQSPIITEQQIWNWMLNYYLHNNQWPTQTSGKASEILSWKGIDSSLRKGHRGVGPGLSLAKLREKFSGVQKEKLTEDTVWKWVNDYRTANGKWPKSVTKDACPDGATWSSVNSAFRYGNRGITSKDKSLSQFIKRKSAEEAAQKEHPNG